MFLKAKLQQDRFCWCNYNFKCHKTTQIRHLQAKQARKNVPPNVFTRFEVRTIVRCMFWRSNHSIKVNWDVFRGYKETSKVSFVYLKGKVQQNSNVQCIFFLFYQGFLSRTLTTYRTAGEGRGPFFIPFYHFRLMYLRCASCI